MDLAQIGEGIQRPERKHGHRQRVVGARRAPQVGKAGAEAPEESVFRAGAGWREGVPECSLVGSLRLLLLWPWMAQEMSNQTAWSRARHLLESPQGGGGVTP